MCWRGPNWVDPCVSARENCVSASLNPSTPQHLPSFITAPGDADILMVVAVIFLLVAVLIAGNLYLRLHSLPERMAHKSKKLQFEIVAVLGLMALFTHNHLFWVIGLLLALIDLPDFGTPLRRIAASVEKLAHDRRGGDETEIAADSAAHPMTADEADTTKPIALTSKGEVRDDA